MEPFNTHSFVWLFWFNVMFVEPRNSIFVAIIFNRRPVLQEFTMYLIFICVFHILPYFIKLCIFIGLFSSSVISLCSILLRVLSRVVHFFLRFQQKPLWNMSVEVMSGSVLLVPTLWGH